MKIAEREDSPRLATSERALSALARADEEYGGKRPEQATESLRLLSRDELHDL